jgi:ABC-type uncharacterized transport system substrate-binding protein
MTRRTIALLMTLALGILVALLAAEAQQPAKIPKIGVLYAGSARSYPYPLQPGLQELGYIEGQNITIEYRFAEENLDRLPDLAAELVQLQVDVIVARGTLVTQAAMQATSTIPIVMATGGNDPVGNSLVASLARPGETSRACLSPSARGLPGSG